MTENNCTETQCYHEDQVDIAAVCLYSIIAVVGLVFNVIALIFFFNQAKSRSQTVIYMTNLAIVDLLLILTLPVRVSYHLGVKNLPSWLCDSLGLILKANMYGSIFLLTCICFDRCMAVAFPMSSFVQEGRKKASLVCVGIWMLTFGASLPVYFTQRSVHADVKRNDCMPVKKCFDSMPRYVMKPAVLYPTLIVGFVIPLLIMVFSSWCLVRAVRQSIVAQTNLVDSRKIQRMITTNILIFLISFLPYHVTLIFLSLKNCAMLDAHRYSLMLACFNTVLDPVAYYFTTDAFSKSMDIRAVWRMFPLNSHSSDTNNRSRTPING